MNSTTPPDSNPNRSWPRLPTLPSEFRVLAELLEQRRRLLGLAITASVLYPLFSILPPWLLQLAIDGVILGDQPFALLGVSGNRLPAGQLAQLWLVGGLVGVAVLMAGGLSALGTLAWGRLGQSIEHALRTGTYDRLQSGSIASIDRHGSGRATSILSNDITEFDGLIEQVGKNLVEVAVRLVGIVVILLVLHWQLAIVLLVVAPPLIGLSLWFFRRIRPVYKAIRSHIAELTDVVGTNLQGIQTIKAYTAEPMGSRRIDRRSAELYASKWKAIRLQGLFYPATGVINALGFVVLLIVGGYWLVQGPPWPFSKPLTVGTLVAFLLYNDQLRKPLVELGAVFDTYLKLRVILQRVERLGTIGSPELQAQPPVPELGGDLEIEAVRFAYPETSEAALDEINVSIPAESFVGIVGRTGSGKTTLAHLLLGFHRPASGSIRFDGRTLDSATIRSLREEIGFVSQQPALFPGTIAENVSLGASGADPIAIEAALRDAHAWDFIDDLEDGVETVVGEGGSSLSGGQRQRIAIARAIYADPTVVVLDEPTSHLDTETEAHLRERFRAWSDRRTIIVITHSLPTVRKADDILVVERGRIVERGNHQNLLANRGPYRRLWSQQTGQVPNSDLQPIDRDVGGSVE